MSKFLGRRDNLAVFSNETNFVSVDTALNVVIETGYVDENFSVDSFEQTGERFELPVLDLVLSALSILEPKPLTASARMYTVPSGVVAEAKKALKWRREEGRGGTPVGLNTARRLSKGGQIGIEKVRHIAKYFPRHEVDKKGKGWEPGEDNFPSNGRIAWALWGGDAAWRWAKAIVERENKNALTADGYLERIGAEIEPFKYAEELQESVAPDFLARVRLDGSGIDRIYKIDLDGRVYVWDDGTWDDLGGMDGDIWSHDSELDEYDDGVEKSHIMIDPESAVVICARLQIHPFENVYVTDIDKEEAELFSDFDDEEELSFIDNAVTAALPQNVGVPKMPVAPGSGDGVYTSEERSKNVKKQVRDARGLFVKMGNDVVVGGDYQSGTGKISRINDDGTVEVQLLNGKKINVDPKITESYKPSKKAPTMVDRSRAQNEDEPLDLSGIIGEPRTPQNMPKARLPGTLPPITSSDLQNLIADWSGWVNSQRHEFKSGGDKSKDSSSSPKKASTTSENYDHPLLARMENRKKSLDKSGSDIAERWARPVVAAAPSDVKERPLVEQKPSDVQPMYLAIVSPEDPRAVMDLISVVPASATSNAPMTYVRKEKKWVREPNFMSDLRSATPPPVVPLNKKVLNEVLLQVDSLTASVHPTYDQTLMILWGPNANVMETRSREFLDEFSSEVESLFAAGGADRNRGQAENLRRYWTRGKGALKIRWGTPGDWKRCVKYLSKYMGVRAKGYCQLRHKDALGYYTSTHAKMDRARNNSAEDFIMEEPVYGFPGANKTVITEKDLLTPVDEILEDSDEIYDNTWEPENSIIEALQEVSGFSDEDFDAIVAAGNWLTNKRKAKRLKKYWTVGKGGLKIRWNSGGDWYRCVKYLTKYLGPRSKGYCALRHKEMTGEWTGDRAHLIKYGGKVGNRGAFSDIGINTTEQVIFNSELIAKSNEARGRMGLVASAVEDESGVMFFIPLVIPEEVESGDGRSFEKGAISFRDLPLPLMWQISTGAGHDGSVVVGRIDHMERTDGGIGNAQGVFDTGVHAKEVVRLIKNGFIKGVSADMDKFEAKKVKPTKKESAQLLEEDDDSIGQNKIVINKARVMGVTIVPKPAFQECTIELNDTTTDSQEEPMIDDGIYVGTVDSSDAQSLVACGFVAGAIPIAPPKKWFDNPKLDRPTPLTVSDDGQVFGHIAAWHVDHIGLSFGTKPPRSKSNYAYFHTGVCRTDDGKDIPVGQLTLAGGHASLEASAAEAVKHYDDTASAVADVHAGEDAYGIWVSGALRPGTSPEQIRSLRASSPSGDWRPIRGSLELVAVCQVNVPGFPVARARVASGAVMALVAAGAMQLAKIKSDPIDDLNSRLEKLELSATSELSSKVQSARDLFATVREERNSELSSKAQELSSRFDSVFAYEDDFTYISRRERTGLAEEGKAMPDGSFPIRNIEDLKNAVQSYGRASESARASVKRFIEKRARSLKRPDLIPDEWKEASNAEFSQKIDSMRLKINEASSLVAALPMPMEQQAPFEAPQGNEGVLPQGKSDAVGPAVEDVNAPTVESGLKVDGRYTPKTQPRDSKGKFRQVLARLNSNIGTSGLQNIVENAREIGAYYELGDYVNSAGSAVKLLDIIGRLDSGALNSKSLENVRSSAAELGKVIANLPLGFNDQTEKVRYSDLPPSLQNLMDDMMEKVEKKIGKDDADIATAELKAFKSGSDVYSQGEISGQMSKMLRLLT